MVGQQPSLVYHNNSWKTPSQMVLESNTASVEGKGVVELYPVSSGLEHQREDQVLSVTGEVKSESRRRELGASSLSRASAREWIESLRCMCVCKHAFVRMDACVCVCLSAGFVSRRVCLVF